MNGPDSRLKANRSFSPSSGRWKYLAVIPIYVAILPVQADVYKWMDEDGRVHYGDRPGSPASEKIEIRRAPAPDEGLELRQEKRQRLLELYEEERAEKHQKMAEEQAKKSEIRRKCQELKYYQRSLKEARRLYELDNEGNRRYLDDAEQQKAITELDETIQKHCS